MGDFLTRFGKECETSVKARKTRNIRKAGRESGCLSRVGLRFSAAEWVDQPFWGARKDPEILNILIGRLSVWAIYRITQLLQVAITGKSKQRFRDHTGGSMEAGTA